MAIYTSLDSLKKRLDAEVHFCDECLNQSRSPRRLGDDLYFTLGGGA